MERALRGASLREIRLLTGYENDTQAWCTRVGKALARSGAKLPTVEWKTTLERAGTAILDVHDRFAVVDDQLWHFGATVGGAHRSVNAFSFGWDAAAARAKEFFEEVWGRA